MTKNNEFLKLIEHTNYLVNEFIKNSERELYRDRYNQILDNLNDLNNAVINNSLYSGFIYLEITQMIDQNDPDELREAVLEINRFYCSNYRKL